MYDNIIEKEEYFVNLNILYISGGILMKCKRIGLISDVVEYEEGKGLEDGYELFSDVVTKGWFITDNLIKVTRENGQIFTPYISHRRGRTFICNGDYVIIDEDGTKHVVGKDKVFNRYKKIEE